VKLAIVFEGVTEVHHRLHAFFYLVA